MQAGPPLSVIPPDVLVAGLELPGRGAKAQSGQQSPVRAPNQVTHLGSAQRAVTQVMMPLDQFIPQTREALAFHLLEDQRLESVRAFPHGLAGVGGRSELDAASGLHPFPSAGGPPGNSSLWAAPKH